MGFGPSAASESSGTGYNEGRQPRVLDTTARCRSSRRPDEPARGRLVRMYALRPYASGAAVAIFVLLALAADGFAVSINRVTAGNPGNAGQLSGAGAAVAAGTSPRV